MTGRKLRTFEQKVNAFLKSFESGQLRHHSKEFFLERYSYLDADEVETLIHTCKGIEEMAYQLACQVTREDHPSNENPGATMQAAIEAKYPYLEAVRVQHLIGRTIYRVLQ